MGLIIESDRADLGLQATKAAANGNFDYPEDLT